MSCWSNCQKHQNKTSEFEDFFINPNLQNFSNHYQNCFPSTVLLAVNKIPTRPNQTAVCLPRSQTDPLIDPTIQVHLQCATVKFVYTSVTEIRFGLYNPIHKVDFSPPKTSVFEGFSDLVDNVVKSSIEIINKFRALKQIVFLEGDQFRSERVHRLHGSLVNSIQIFNSIILGLPICTLLITIDLLLGSTNRSLLIVVRLIQMATQILSRVTFVIIIIISIQVSHWLLSCGNKPCKHNIYNSLKIYNIFIIFFNDTYQRKRCVHKGSE